MSGKRPSLNLSSPHKPDSLFLVSVLTSSSSSSNLSCRAAVSSLLSQSDPDVLDSSNFNTKAKLFLGPSFLQKVSCPLVLHQLRAVRLFIQCRSDVPSLLSQVYAVNHAAGCSKLEVPSIQRRGTYISLR